MPLLRNMAQYTDRQKGRLSATVRTMQVELYRIRYASGHSRGVQGADMMRINIPNPGSDEAIKQGCKCAVLDNHHGQGFFMAGAFQFWITEDCPLHGLEQFARDCGLIPDDEDWSEST